MRSHHNASLNRTPGRIPGTALLIVLALMLALLALPLAAPATGAAPPPRPLSDAPWSADVRVDDDAGTRDQIFPSIAVDPNGNAYAVWQDYRPAYYGIYFAYRPVCGSWGASVRVDDESRHKAWPSIAVDSSGNAYAVWQDYRNGNDDIYFSYRPAGGEWAPNVRVNDDAGTAGQRDPAVAVNGSGDAYAIWADSRNGPYSDIYFAYRPAGGAWGGNVKVNDDLGRGRQSRPSIAVDPNGNAYAVWGDSRGVSHGDIYFAYRRAGGSWGANVRVNDDGEPMGLLVPDIAVDASGNAYAVWRSWNSDVFFAHRPAGGDWGANVKVNDDGMVIYIPWPSIAVDPNGNAFAVWQDSRNGDMDIYFSYRPAGGAWGANGRVNDDSGTASQPYAEVAVDASGNAYAVWYDRRSGNSDIYFSSLGSQVFAVGDLVWRDANEDGLQDSSEPGMQGVTVDLYATKRCGGAPIANEPTDANGNYLFCVDSGTYCMEFSNIPEGWAITHQDEGTDDTRDSDANPDTGRIRNIVMVPGASDLDEDVGLIVAEEFVPELGTLALLGSGLVGLAGYASLRWRK